MKRVINILASIDIRVEKKVNVQMDNKGLLYFTYRLIQTPSIRRNEAQIARLIADKMKKLIYDELHIDEKNGVMGKLSGFAEGKSIMLNGQIDHSEVGTTRDPYEPKDLNGHPFGYKGRVIRGRGATDMKRAVAAIVYAAGMIKHQGIPLP